VGKQPPLDGASKFVPPRGARGLLAYYATEFILFSL